MISREGSCSVMHAREMWGPKRQASPIECIWVGFGVQEQRDDAVSSFLNSFVQGGRSSVTTKGWPNAEEHVRRGYHGGAAECQFLPCICKGKEG